MAQILAASADPVAAAHARLLTDRGLQFSFSAAETPKALDVPDWLIWVGRALAALAPYMPYVFWGGLILIALIVVYSLVRGLLDPSRRAAALPTPPVAPAEAWRPSEKDARALLEDADRLAAEGQYEQAAHLLLLRSIEDIRLHRPELIRPSLTSRDIGDLPALAETGGPGFRRIAQVVERSLFGGWPVTAEAFAQCRATYAGFALPRARA